MGWLSAWIAPSPFWKATAPMAAALTSHLAAGRGLELTVGSASTLLRPGHRATPAALAVLRARGIDAETHRSRTLTPEIVAGADLVGRWPPRFDGPVGATVTAHLSPARMHLFDADSGAALGRP